MYLEVTTPDDPKKVLWRESTCEWYTGGFQLDKANLPAGLTNLPKGTVVSIDFETRSAKVVKTVALYQALTATDTELRVSKSNILVQGDVIGTGGNTITVGAIDTSNAEYDAIAITAGELGELPAGTVLSESVSGTVGFNYAPKPLKGTVAVSATIQAYEIQGKNLPFPVTDAIKELLTHRHQFNN